MVSKILFRLFNLPIIGNKLLWLITDRTGKDRESAVIREYVKLRRGVEVGMYSYGGCFEPEFCLGGRVTIERYSSLASGIRYFGANHPISAALASPYFYNQEFYAVVAGVPARIIRYRFDKDVADMLERSQWWELSPSDIPPFVSLIDDPLSFCSALATLIENQ